MNEEKRELFNEEVSEEINKAVNKDITGSSVQKQMITSTDRNR